VLEVGYKSAEEFSCNGEGGCIAVAAAAAVIIIEIWRWPNYLGEYHHLLLIGQRQLEFAIMVM